MRENFLENLVDVLKKGIPGEDAHLKMSPLNRGKSSQAILGNTTYKESAVAVILYPKEQSIECILTQRQEYKGKHSGQISFPGGKKEAVDIHIEYTARRETFEEIGIPIANGILVCELTSVYIPVSDFLIKPFIYFHEELPTLSPNTREVAEIFTFTLEELLDQNSFSTLSFEISPGITKDNIPCFTLNGKNVWGATALILNELREVLIRMSE
jgi:8-oxo-dGTP pyrophosphatase MutT (NUDIX family)